MILLLAPCLVSYTKLLCFNIYLFLLDVWTLSNTVSFIIILVFVMPFFLSFFCFILSFVASFFLSFFHSFNLSFFLSLYFVSSLLVVCLSVCLSLCTSFISSFVRSCFHSSCVWFIHQALHQVLSHSPSTAWHHLDVWPAKFGGIRNPVRLCLHRAQLCSGQRSH